MNFISQIYNSRLMRYLQFSRCRFSAAASAIALVTCVQPLLQPRLAAAQATVFPAPGLPWLPSPPDAFQQQDADGTAQTLAEAALFTVRTDEVRIDGTVRAINSSRKRFVLETDVMVLQPESSGDLDSLPARTILIDRATILWMPSGERTFDFAVLERGAEAIVIGAASRDGRLVRARLVALLREASPTNRVPVHRPKTTTTRRSTRVTVSSQRAPSRLSAKTATPKTAPKVLSRHTESPSRTQSSSQAQKRVQPKIALEKPRAGSKTPIAKSNSSTSTEQGTLSRAPSSLPARSSQAPSPDGGLQAMAPVPPRGDSKLSAIEAPTEWSPRLHAPTAIVGRDASQSNAQAANTARLKAPAPTAMAPPKATMEVGTLATRTAAPSQPTMVERAQSTLEPSVSQPQTIRATPPRLTSPTPASPIGRLASSFATPDLPLASADAPLAEPARAIVPPLQAHPDSQRAKTQADREEVERAWKLTARHKFQASREAQRDIRFTYFSGLVSDSPTILDGTNDDKIVALTFDDGPHPTGTVAILDALKRERVPATFFVVGRNVEKHPELVLRAVAEGHEIANHTHRHLQRASMSVGEWTQEIDRNNRVIAGVLGGAPRWFRAPGCRYSFAALQAINELGMIRVDTTNNSGDWEQPNPDAIARRVLNRLAPGQVLLFHDPAPQTARALPQILLELKRRGYRCVSLTELAQRAQATPGFEPLWCPPGQGIVVAAAAPGSATNSATVNIESGTTIGSLDAPLQVGGTP